MTDKLEALKAAVANESLPLNQRRDAADYFVRTALEGVPEPGENEAEVVTLRQPWPRTTQTDAWLADSWSETSNGRSIYGFTLPDARAAVLKRRKRDVLSTLVTDETTHTLIRSAAQSAVQTR